MKQVLTDQSSVFFFILFSFNYSIKWGRVRDPLFPFMRMGWKRLNALPGINDIAVNRLIEGRLIFFLLFIGTWLLLLQLNVCLLSDRISNK